MIVDVALQHNKLNFAIVLAPQGQYGYCSAYLSESPVMYRLFKYIYISPSDLVSSSMVIDFVEVEGLEWRDSGPSTRHYVCNGEIYRPLARHGVAGVAAPSLHRVV